MTKNLGRDFSRLARASNPVDPRAPWWVNWLLQIGVTALVIWGLAAALDYGWQLVTGRSLGAACGLIGLLPSTGSCRPACSPMLIGAVLAGSGPSIAALASSGSCRHAALHHA